MMRLLLVKDLLVVDQKTILYLYALTRMLLLFFVVKNSPVVNQKVILYGLMPKSTMMLMMSTAIHVLMRHTLFDTEWR
jgi:hypothetical protein